MGCRKIFSALYDSGPMFGCPSFANLLIFVTKLNNETKELENKYNSTAEEMNGARDSRSRKVSGVKVVI